jgi:putative ABC transport system permease protein
MKKPFSFAFYLAWRDYWHEWLLSLCSILGLVAVLAPLLVLAGVRYGIIAGLESKLKDDPRNLEIIPAGSGHYTQMWFEQLKNFGGVGFLIPQTRSIAASMDIYGNQQKETVELIPSAPHDPLLARWRIDFPDCNRLQKDEPTPVVLSALSAQSLRAEAGQIMEAVVGRVRDGVRETASQAIVVRAVMPLEAQQKYSAYVPLAFLLALEDYRDGLAVPALNWPGASPEQDQRVFASFRLYADSLDAVEPLALRLADKFAIQVSARAEEISMVRSLDNSFALIFWLISGAAAFGFAAAVASNALAGVKRKSRSLAILRLLGHNRRLMVFFPMWQAWFTGGIGFIVSSGLYWLVATTMNRLFTQSGIDKVCDLQLWRLLAAFLATMILCAAASTWAAVKAAAIDPAEVIRDV